ncbi:hypothetical protein [Heyndrickxia faecalis]|uniref:hypothetical protein n=1 Tax=Heyndrickxia faecalis TaxID=2824910 RepID=UPI003D1D6026
MNLDNYEEIYTTLWHTTALETKGYVVCAMSDATHVVFSESDLILAGKDGINFTKNHIYPIRRIEESGDLLIIDDKGQAIVGFDLFIPCEYLKQWLQKIQLNQCDTPFSTKVFSLSEYKSERMK